VKRNLSIYGISEKKFKEMEKKQNFRCFICKQMFPPWRLSVDHCHETGLNRGLLCRNCNTGLGMFKDSKKLLGRAIFYLNTYPTVELIK
jgi:hypothetical protein